MHRLGHTVLVGDAANIRAMVVGKTKTDQRDARHLLDLLHHDRFPTVWVPDPATRDLRALLTHRQRLVRIQTMLKNGLHAIALNQRLVRGSKLLRRAGVAQLQALPLPPYTARRRDHSLELLEALHAKLQELDAAIATAALAHPDAPRLLTHPGVGPLTALATVVVLGPVTRFADAKHVVSYVGLAPSLQASADKYRLGHITNRAARCSAGSSARRPPTPRGSTLISNAPTARCAIAAGARRPGSPSPASSSCACSSCGAITSTTPNFGAAAARPRQSPSANARARGRPTALVPVRACSRSFMVVA